MQLFMPNKSLIQSAESLDDLRLRIQLKEAAQILSTAIFNKTEIINDGLYKPYNKNGRFTKWVQSSKYAFLNIVDYCKYLHNEYQYRFNKEHKSFLVIKNCEKYVDIFPEIGYKNYVGCKRCEELMNELDIDIHEAYQIVLSEKWINDIKKPKWTNRNKPRWFNEA